MKKILIHLSILSLLAFVSLPMTACAPKEETTVEIEVEGDYVEEELVEVDEYHVEMEEIEETEEEPPWEEELEEEPPPAE